MRYTNPLIKADSLLRPPSNLNDLVCKQSAQYQYHEINDVDTCSCGHISWKYELLIKLILYVDNRKLRIQIWKSLTVNYKHLNFQIFNIVIFTINDAGSTDLKESIMHLKKEEEEEEEKIEN